MVVNQSELCPSCGKDMTGKYCSACGEKKIHKHDFSLKHFIEEGIEGLTHFDNKFLRSVKLLFSRPGMLTTYYSEGRRVFYMKPFQLFIVCNLIFFLLSGKFNFFSKSLQVYFSYTPYIHFNTRSIINALAPTDELFRRLATTFNERMATASKALLVLFIPVLAAGSIIFLKKGKFIGEHLAFAAHFFSFILIYYILFNFLILSPFYATMGTDFNQPFDQITAIVNRLVFIGYYTLAAKRFYRTSTFHALSGAVLVTILFTLAIFAYRILLFYKIIYSIQL